MTTFPLSVPQQHMWEYLRFLNPADPGRTWMNQVLAYRVKGPFDVSRMERALNTLAGRHDALRITFTDLGPSPRLRITPELTITLSPVDLTALPADRREEAAVALAAEADTWSFDLVNGPLMHASVATVDEQDHLLVIALHHMVTDGWSGWLLRKELTALYSGRALPELPSGYREFATSPGRNPGESVAYWSRRLAGAPRSLDLPTDRPRETMAGCDYAFHALTIDPALARAVVSLARRSRVSLYVVFLSAYQALLHRKTGRHDIVVGSIFAQRTDSTTTSLIGLFNNVVFFRTQVDPSATFAELVTQVSRTTRDAYAHVGPFQEIARSLYPGFDAERPWPAQNLYHAWLQFAVPPDVTRHPGDLELDWFRYDLPDPVSQPLSPAQHRLLAKENPSFELHANGGGGLIQYNRHLFDEKTIAGLADDLMAILAAATENPAIRIEDLPVALAGD
ncbi:condensation domain-containing protein [Actinocrispum sp. NPDC049592]|uniref:condensation domain-containing protein n=1 Tax=Actinocrispum sp. NPDC049592 TaxID=3154835 RepID=UPI00341D47C7